MAQESRAQGELMNQTNLPPRDQEGFLLEASDWHPIHAQALIAHLSVRLDDRHFEVIEFLRQYYDRYQHLPNGRMFIRAIAQQLGVEKGNSVYLNLLFKGQALKHASMAAGLPKPPGCL